ncbi:MAG: hypothetical protein BGN97_16805 [Microbacterium sp. 69-10]|uniref:peptidoglycan-binding domain-containing protein n=1 Tax=Microbacterium sp. 69-10 TaxID=1895783 RepID=UPI00096135AC|nr:peptidoglycan-binding domain-containing protein [Microbacterium sp. 69-10]OJU40844.1 MAG: hypothetical protein BGN97_16805 [Microbacterium sp. 69-10]
MRRALVCSAVVLGAAVLIGGGWFAATIFVSPGQVEAAANPPEQAPLIAEVERGDLTSSDVFPASVEFADRQVLTLSPAAGDARAVVTSSLVGPGEVVKSGQMVATVNGSPVFLIESPFPFYRDVGVGDSGPDVEALQNQLVGLGLLDGADGEFGSRTASALRRLYAGQGATPPLRAAPSDTEPAAAEAADDATSDPAEKQVYLPLTSILTAPHLPATVRSVPAVGEIVSEATALTLDSAAVVVRMQIGEATDVAVGDSVRVAVDGLDELDGTVQDVTVPDAGGESEQADSPSSALATVTPTGMTPPSEAVGKAATVIANERVLASNALLVPLSAVKMTAGGEGQVLLHQDGQFQRVDVRVIATVDGSAAIEPLEGRIDAGQEVRLG